MGRIVVVVVVAAKSGIGRRSIVGRAMHGEVREVVVELPESSGELPSREVVMGMEMGMLNDGVV